MSTYKRVSGNLTIQTLSANDIVTIDSATVNMTGNLTVTGNATLQGNILGDRLVNGTTSIEIQSVSGNANVTVGGASNVAVFTPTGVIVTGTYTANGTITGGNLATAGTVSAGGNITGANINTPGNIFLTRISTATSSPVIRFSDSNTAVTTLGANIGIQFEGTTDDANEIRLIGADATEDRTITLPNLTGTVALTSQLDDSTY